MKVASWQINRYTIYPYWNSTFETCKYVPTQKLFCIVYLALVSHFLETYFNFFGSSVVECFLLKIQDLMNIRMTMRSMEPQMRIMMVAPTLDEVQTLRDLFSNQWLDLNLNQGLQRFKVWKLHIFSFHIELWFSRLFDSRKFSIVSIVHPFLRLLVLSKLDVRGCQLSVPDMNVDGAGPLALHPTCLLLSVSYTALSTQPHVSRGTCLLPCRSLTVQTRQWAVTQWAKCLSILTIKSVNKGSLPKIEIKCI